MTNIYLLFNNAGSVTASSGTIELSANGSHTGAFTIGGGATLRLNGGTHTFNAASSIGGAGTLEIASGQMNIASPLTINAAIVSLNGGTMTGAANRTVTNQFDFHGGTLSGTGTTTIAASTGVLNIPEDPGYPTIDGHTLTNLGTATYAATSTYLSLANGATLDNAYLFYITSSAILYAYGTGPNRLVNSGTLAKQGVGTETVVYPVIESTGNIAVQAGALTPMSGGTYSAQVLMSGGALIRFNGGTHTFLTGSTLGGAGEAELAAGTLNTDGPTTISVSVLRLTGGTFGGAANRTINKTLEWRSGTITGGPATTTTIAATGTLLFPAGVAAGYGYTTLDAHTLAVNGPTTYEPSYYLSLANGAQLTNSAAFSLNGDSQIYAYGTGTPLIVNTATGSITKSGGTFVTTLAPAVNNDGNVTAASGTLALSGGGTSNGTFTASTGILRFSNGTHSLSASSTVTGAGQVEFTAGSVTLAGAYTVTGTTIVSGGTATFDAAASTGVLNVSGGIMQGSGAVSVTGPFLFHGGTLKGTGTTTVLAGGSASFLNDVGYSYLDGRTLTINAASTYGGGPYYLSIYNGGVLATSGTFDIQNDAPLYSNGVGSPRIDNSGTFQKTAGTGETIVYCGFNNSGSTAVTSGTLSFNGGGTNPGMFTATAPAVLRFNGGAHSLTAPSAVSGTGTMRFSNGTTTLAGSYALTGSGLTLVDAGAHTFNAAASSPALTIAGGTLQGSGAITVSGAFTFSGGTLGGTGTTTVLASGSAAFPNNTGYAYLDGRTLTINAASTYGGGPYYLSIYNGGVLATSGTFDIQNDAPLYSNGVGSPRIDNSGTFQKTAGTGETIVYCGFNNSGSTAVTSGILSFNGGGTSPGMFTATAPAVLRFNGGAHSLTAPSAVSGTGTMRFSNGTTTLAGSYALTGSGLTLVDAGAHTFNAAASSPALTIAGGTLQGSGAITVSGAFTFSGGTLGGTGTTTVLAGGSAAFPNDTGYAYLDGRTLVLNSNATYGGGPYYLSIYNGGVLQNAATFDITSDVAYIYSNGVGTPRIDNSGTFQKTGGTAATTIYPQLNNTGTVAVTSGILSLSGGGSGSGAFGVTSPGILRFAGGTHTLSGAISSNGTIEVTTGAVNASGPFANSGLTSIPGGTLSLTAPSASMQNLDLTGGTLGGSSQIGVAGTMNWSTGTLGGTTIVQIAASPGAVNLTGPGAKYLLGATLRNGGSGTWSGTGWVYGNQGGAIENLAGATLTRSDTGAFYYYCCTGAASRFENQAGATFVRNGTATSQFLSANVTNAGTIDVQAGTLDFSTAPFVQTAGAFSIAAGANAASNGAVDFQGGALMGGGTFTGNVLNSGGTVKPGTSPGALTIDGNYTQGASGSLDVELAGLTAGTQFDQLNVTGTASLGGTLNVALLSPYVPVDGNSYRILTFGSLAPSPNNAFATTNGTDLGGGNSLNVMTGATYVDLVTTGNAAPVANPDTGTYPEDTSLGINVLLNDTDPNGNPLTITGFTPATNGTAACGTATCTYTPNANFNGSDSFTYTVSDGFVSSVGTVTITVTPVNDPPTAGADAATTTANAPVLINVLSNDSDIDGGPLSVLSSTNGSIGTVSCTPAGSCTYTPAGSAGTDSFTYTVSDGPVGRRSARSP